MKRRTMPWVFAVLLMIAGTISAHALGYMALSSASHAAGNADPDHGAEMVGRASHGVLTQTPLFIGLIVAFLIAAFVRRVLTASQVERGQKVAPYWFFLLPPFALIIQETAERMIHAESFPFNPAHEPAFLAALALQVPFGFAVFLIARVLLRVADALGRALFGSRGVPPVREARAPFPTQTVGHKRSVAVREGHSSRSPPLLALT